MNKIKTFVDRSYEVVEDAVNSWGETHKVFATQTDTFVLGDTPYHKATVFYKED